MFGNFGMYYVTMYMYHYVMQLVEIIVFVNVNTYLLRNYQVVSISRLGKDKECEVQIIQHDFEEIRYARTGKRYRKTKEEFNIFQA